MPSSANFVPIYKSLVRPLTTIDQILRQQDTKQSSSTQWKVGAADDTLVANSKSILNLYLAI
jgi:hypothetical protein